MTNIAQSKNQSGFFIIYSEKSDYLIVKIDRDLKSLYA